MEQSNYNHGTMDQRNNVTVSMVPWNNGTMEKWNKGTMAKYNNGTM